MLESTPLVATQAVAEQVSSDPASWVEAFAAARSDIQTGGHDTGLLARRQT